MQVTIAGWLSDPSQVELDDPALDLAGDLIKN